MKYLNNYKQFVNENNSPEEMVELAADANILESIVTDSDLLLKTIEAKEENIYTSLGLNPDLFSPSISIENLYEDKNFDKALKNKKLKKSKLEETEEYETFLENTMDVKFFLIHKENKSELDKPEYIVFQNKKTTDSKWNDLKFYSVNGDIRKFYDKLTNKTIEIKKGDKSYIYFTSNSGNNWQLQNVEAEDNIYKNLLDKDEIKLILKDKDIKITIIS